MDVEILQNLSCLVCCHHWSVHRKVDNIHVNLIVNFAIEIDEGASIITQKQQQAWIFIQSLL